MIELELFSWYFTVAFFIGLLSIIPISVYLIKLRTYGNHSTYIDCIFGTSVGAFCSAVIGAIWPFSIFVFIIATILYWYHR